jgi:hypothetical protein
MRKFLLAASAAVALATAGTLPASAAPFGVAGFKSAAQEMNFVEKAQVFVYGGHRHCWYATGWNGPGWYRCGYRWRRKLGWGGPSGWQGWAVPGPVVVVKKKPRRPAKVIVRP